MWVLSVGNYAYIKYWCFFLKCTPPFHCFKVCLMAHEHGSCWKHGGLYTGANVHVPCSRAVWIVLISHAPAMPGITHGMRARFKYLTDEIKWRISQGLFMKKYFITNKVHRVYARAHVVTDSPRSATTYPFCMTVKWTLEWRDARRRPIYTFYSYIIALACLFHVITYTMDPLPGIQ